MRVPTTNGFLGVSSKQTRLVGFAGGMGEGESWGDGVQYKLSPCVLFISYSFTALSMRHMLNDPSFFSAFLLYLLVFNLETREVSEKEVEDGLEKPKPRLDRRETTRGDGEQNSQD